MFLLLIGGIFDSETDVKSVFELSVKAVNTMRHELPQELSNVRFDLLPHEIAADSFDASRKGKQNCRDLTQFPSCHFADTTKIIVKIEFVQKRMQKEWLFS